MTSSAVWNILVQRCRDHGPGTWDRDLNRDIHIASLPPEAEARRSTRDRYYVSRYIYSDGTCSPLITAQAPDVSHEIDSAIRMIKQFLPGWWWSTGACHVSDDARIAPDFSDPKHRERLHAEIGEFDKNSPWNEGFDVDRRPPGNPAIALCEAYCMAQEALAKRAERKVRADAVSEDK